VSADPGFLLETVRTVCANQWELLFLLDEFDITFGAPDIFDQDFFGTLRALMSQPNLSVAYVLSSVVNPRDLIEPGARDNLSSLFFNTFATPLYLGAFSATEARELAYQPAHRAGVEFHSLEIAAVVEEAGLLPFQIQGAASALFDARVNPRQQLDPIAVMRIEYRAFIQKQFETYWRHFSDEERAALKSPDDPMRAAALKSLERYGFVRARSSKGFEVLGKAFADYVAAA
jgi:hypothetical protein